MKDEYNKLLLESGLFSSGANKGSFILPPNGLKLWLNIQTILDKKFAKYGVQNVLLPTLIPLNLLEKEKKHIAGFNPECFYIEKVGEKQLDIPLILRPTSEVLFYEWYRQILQSYQQLPFLYNQWCQVFRAEKNTKPFLRNTEFLWQEGHTLHQTAEEAKDFALNIWQEYRDYVEKYLRIAIITGKKSENEKFAGALESYTVECLLPDGQCLQLATSHYFGDNFCQSTEVHFRDEKNELKYPFSTSWGTSTRSIGALAKTHVDNWGIILPFDIAPVQIAFILIGQSPELINYYQEINNILSSIFRCQLYNRSKQVNLNASQADKEGCPFKIILGPEELKKNEITLIRRDNIERKITIGLENNELEQKYALAYEKYMASLNEANDELGLTNKKLVLDSFKKGIKQGGLFRVISKEKEEFQKNLFQKSLEFRDKHVYSVDNFSELEKSIREDLKSGFFLIPFCNQVECEKTIPRQIPSYSIRCLDNKKKAAKCIFCSLPTSNLAYLGRSY